MTTKKCEKMTGLWAGDDQWLIGAAPEQIGVSASRLQRPVDDP
jgi:hypothetical protein